MSTRKTEQRWDSDRKIPELKNRKPMAESKGKDQKLCNTNDKAALNTQMPHGASSAS